jgi:DNA-binding transcriptional regulator YiaG
MKKSGLTQTEAFKMLEERQKSGIAPTYRITKVRLPAIITHKDFAYIRQGLGLSQQKLAKILNTSVRTIQGYEQGRHRISGIVSKTMLKMSVSPEFYTEMQGEVKKPIPGRKAEKTIKAILTRINQLTKEVLRLKHQIAA